MRCWPPSSRSSGSAHRSAAGTVPVRGGSRAGRHRHAAAVRAPARFRRAVRGPREHLARSATRSHRRRCAATARPPRISRRSTTLLGPLLNRVPEQFEARCARCACPASRGVARLVEVVRRGTCRAPVTEHDAGRAAHARSNSDAPQHVTRARKPGDRGRAAADRRTPIRSHVSSIFRKLSVREPWRGRGHGETARSRLGGNGLVLSDECDLRRSLIGWSRPPPLQGALRDRYRPHRRRGHRERHA